ncbi:MAG: hypothetical protein MRT15_03950 [archaeon YNP-LCB-003-016]|uniref:hypothetical protein n=1 Tax=Candidatus Culexarchaeum yellowstonense TaxID=2928963 RepID=UPI0026EEE8DE|nr:hypothetical protein [Candidatus Culexarchaeum yellowstonense]MCR6691521.1 hypothetical protein [Candidatus Culexarchaeum yellowstonense]
MPGELLLIRGETDGTSTTGTVPLYSDVFYSTVTYIRMPKGMAAKIWFKKISGEGETLFTLQYTRDVTASSPIWVNVEAEKLSAKGELEYDKRRPVILRSINGTEAFQIIWSQPSAVKAYIELGVEFE